MNAQHIGPATGIRKRERDRHLAAHIGIGSLELHDFDYLLVWHQLDEVAMVSVGVRSGLAGPVRRVVGERNAERTTFASFERVYVASHAIRHHPDRDRACIDKRTIDVLPRGVHVLTQPSGGHKTNLPPNRRRADGAPAPPARRPG